MAREFLFNLPGITCQGCVSALDVNLKELIGKEPLFIISYSLDITEKKILIKVEDTALARETISQELTKIIRDDSFVECQEIESIQSHVINIKEEDDEPTKPLLQKQVEDKPTNSFAIHVMKGVIGLVLGFGLMILAWTGITIPAGIMIFNILVSTAITLVLGQDSYIETIKGTKRFFKTGTLGMDALFTVSTLTALTISFLHIFYPWLPMMAEVGPLTFGFRNVGKAIEDYIKLQVTKNLTFTEKAPQQIEQLVDTGFAEYTETAEVKLLKPDAIIRVKSGETVPVDCECLEEKTAIYKTIINGSTLPITIHRGEEISAGMVVPEHVTAIRMRVVRPVAQSHLAKKDHDILNANEKKAPIELTANKILKYFVPSVILFAIASSVGVGFFYNFPLAVQWGAAILGSACPCTFGFLVSLAIKNGMKTALENGVNFKTSYELQSATFIKNVIFDLNGTLTTGVPVVTQTKSYANQNMNCQTFYNYLYAIEKRAPHPIARAIYSYLENKISQDLSSVISEIDTTNNSGIKAKIRDEIYLVGNSQFLQDHHIAMPQADNETSPIEQVIYLARKNDKVVLGHVKVQDPLRDDAKATVSALLAMGKQVFICTGAPQNVAQRYARELGIPAEHIYAVCVDKAAVVKQLLQYGETTMVGDAANDVVAVTASTLGVAIKSNSGCEITQDRAGAVIENPNLLSVVTTFKIADNTVSSIKQNLLISIGYNSLMLLGSGGMLLYKHITLNAGLAVGLMVGQTCVILLNQYYHSRRGYTYQPLENVNSTQSPASSSYGMLFQNELEPQPLDPRPRRVEEPVDFLAGIKTVTDSYTPAAFAINDASHSSSLRQSM